MTYNSQIKIENARKNGRRRQWFRRVSGVLACFAVIATGYGLIRPAVTMTSDTYCGLPEHTHSEVCCVEDIICTQEDHEHTEECFGSILICGEEEHVHTLACYSNPDAVETQDDIAVYLDGLEPTGSLGEDAAAVASCMVGYREREDNYSVCSDGETVKGYTFFGDCAGAPYAMPVVTIDGMDYIGTLTVPALDLELPIMNDWDYPRLRIAPCRYYGSVYQHNMVVAAHNYSTHFGRLNTLSVGETIIFTDADGNIFRYQIVDFEVLGRDAREEMLAGDWDMTLFTCTYGGKTRFTVRCALVE